MSILLSATEVAKGGTRLVTLPDGRHTYISVPINAFNGQIIRLEGWGKQVQQGGRSGALIITLTVPPQISKTFPTGTAFNPRVLALIGLALVVVIGSFASFFVIQSTHNTQVLNTQKTTTAVNATSTANTAIAIHSTNATATTTVGMSLTATATLGVTPTPSLTLVMNDPLQDNSMNNNWITSSSSSGGCGFSGGTYHATNSQTSSLKYCDAKSTNYSNFYYQITMNIIKGDGGGITFRAQGGNSVSFYFFLVTSNGFYYLDVYTNNIVKLLESGSVTLGSGDNVLGVWAMGTTIGLYLNNKLIDSRHDASYPSGQIGVGASDISDTADVSFSNAKVWIPSES